MPTVFKEKGFRFLFYSNEGREPCHIHVIGHGGEAKFWVPSCELEYVYGLNAKDLNVILSIIKKNNKRIQEAWNAFFKSGSKN